jgi:hypothetical protein
MIRHGKFQTLDRSVGYGCLVRCCLCSPSHHSLSACYRVLKARGRPASRRTSSTVDVLALRQYLQWDGGDGATMANGGRPQPQVRSCGSRHVSPSPRVAEARQESRRQMVGKSRIGAATGMHYVASAVRHAHDSNCRSVVSKDRGAGQQPPRKSRPDGVHLVRTQLDKCAAPTFVSL